MLNPPISNFGVKGIRRTAQLGDYFKAGAAQTYSFYELH